IHYVNGKQKARIPFGDNSGERGNHLVTRIVQRGEYDLIAWVDPNYGLGTFEYCSINNPCVFSVVGVKKCYFNLVQGRELSMKAGEKVYWHGGYTIAPRFNGENDITFKKLENLKEITVADFLKP